jgi:hypothetical protein
MPNERSLGFTKCIFKLVLLYSVLIIPKLAALSQYHGKELCVGWERIPAKTTRGQGSDPYHKESDTVLSGEPQSA